MNVGYHIVGVSNFAVNLGTDGVGSRVATSVENGPARTPWQ